MRFTSARRVAYALAAWSCGLSHWACAASAAPFAAPEQIASTPSTTGPLRVVIALVVVLGAVIAAGRVAKRMRGFGAAGNAGLQVLGQLPLGTRERAVLIRVGDRQLLIGVAPGNVRTLHVFDELLLPQGITSSEAAGEQAGDATARPSFKALLLKSLGK